MTYALCSTNQSLLTRINELFCLSRMEIPFSDVPATLKAMQACIDGNASK